MAFEAEREKVVFRFTFTDLLALIVVLSCLCFQFYAGFFLSKVEMKDNTTLIQILTNISNYIMLILTFYFGSNLLAARQASGQAQTINEMQKIATAAALNAGNVPTAAATEIKIDKAVKIAELKAALEKLEPDSDEAKALLLELEALEKNS